ncbi:hypothetical protein LCM28_05635 [Salipiger pacificus]|nr:hypothetical protein [Alloyangia pacifica]
MSLARLFTRDVRQILFVALPIIFFGIPTVRNFLENDPSGVEAYGPFITIWALFNISIGKSKYEGSIEKWKFSRLWEYIKHMEVKDQFRDEALDRTFDLHASQIVQINAKLGKENPFCESNPEAIREFCERVKKRMSDGPEFIAKQERNDKLMSDFEKKYKAQVDEMTSWSSYLWRFEIGMAVWGTLQAGYGEDVTKLFHQLSIAN